MNPLTPTDLSTLWHMSRVSLESLEQPYGLAASDEATGLYNALFGRDSLWSLLLLLDAAETIERGGFRDWVLDLGARVLLSLGKLQATDLDDDIEAAPGKIPHEVRERLDGRLQAYEMPFKDGRSYAGFDQTFLYVTAVRRYLDAAPQSPLRAELTSTAMRAITWIEEYGDADADGLYEHARRHRLNPVHQVWKDSFDSITLTGFDVPTPPVAWVEVQGYAYRALYDGAALARSSGKEDAAQRLERRAGDLQQLVQDAFWIDERGCYAVALDGQKKKVISVTTNPGHLLWAGLPDETRAATLAERLVRPDCLTSYGLRTLVSTDPHFAPYAYHRGSIWPFDNAVVAAGMLRYGSAHAVNVLEGICRALKMIGTCAEAYVAIETALFVDLPASQPVALSLRRLPVANNVQAFSAAALAYATSRLAAHERVDLNEG